MISVAGYCRVSTNSEDQANSFESQKKFFREYIGQHSDWELCDIYADEGITGTSTKKRLQFNRMMNDAYCKKFQLIITKEVSRFSRNILDTISYTRELKALGIGVIFMSDGFCTLDPDAELRLSIMGSIAQEESRKTSTRVKWGQTRQMERGVVFGTSLLGYDVQNGTLSINPDGAEIVKQIFYKYGIEKKGTTVIARELREAGYKTYAGNSAWRESHILKILKNEKYVGDLVQKKTITPDYLTHAKKYNHGEEDLIIIKDHHKGIVSRDLWNLVQSEISKRNRNSKLQIGHSNRYIFSGNIICGECGSRFISRTKTRKDGSSYRRWGCLRASREGKKRIDAHGNALGCDIGKMIRDDLAIEILKSVLTNLNIDYSEIIRNIAVLADKSINDSDKSTKTPAKMQRQIESIEMKKHRAIDSHLSGIITKDELLKIKTQYDQELASLQNQMRAASSDSEQNQEKTIHEVVENIISCQITSETYFKALLESMCVHKDGLIEVKLNELPAIWKFQLFTGNSR